MEWQSNQVLYIYTLNFKFLIDLENSMGEDFDLSALRPFEDNFFITVTI